MTMSEILNGGLLYALVAIGLVYVFAMCVVLFIKAWNRCKELNIDATVMRNVVKSSAFYSIAPSVAIVIGLFTLSAVLGVPWPWFRLSVVGAVNYELLAADMVATGAGFDSIGAMAQANNPGVLGAVMLVMSISIMGAMITLIFFGKKIQKSMLSYRKKHGGWGALSTVCFSLAMIVVFLPVQLFRGPVFVATLLTSAAVTWLHDVLATKYGMRWLNNFTMGNSLLLGMASSVLWVKLLG